MLTSVMQPPKPSQNRSQQTGEISDIYQLPWILMRKQVLTRRYTIIMVNKPKNKYRETLFNMDMKRDLRQTINHVHSHIIYTSRFHFVHHILSFSLFINGGFLCCFSWFVLLRWLLILHSSLLGR